MVQWAIAEARAKGCKLVELLTHHTRVDAQRFYVRLGFAPTALMSVFLAACGPRFLRRYLLTGERFDAKCAAQIGLVSEITSREDLWSRAHQIAATIAAKPSVATQGTVKAVWDSLDMGRRAAMTFGLSYVQLGNPVGGEATMRQNAQRPEPRRR